MEKIYSSLFFRILFLASLSLCFDCTAQRIAGGHSHSLAVCADGTIMVWGSNAYSQLGNGTTVDENVPSPLSGFTNAKAVAGGGEHSLALKTDGTVWGWGDNRRYQAGDGTNRTSTTTPTRVNFIDGVIAIGCGEIHSLALKNDGTVWEWGHVNYYDLNVIRYDFYEPYQVHAGQGPSAESALRGITAISDGGRHSLALKNDGTVWALGKNDMGQLGNNLSGDASQVAFQVILGPRGSDIALTGIIAIAAGEYHSLALKNDGTVWAWGLNNNGQLGNGTTSAAGCQCLEYPVQVSGLSGVCGIAAGGSHSMALKSDGTIWTWGLNANGQLGDGTTTAHNSPVRVSSTGAAFLSIAGGYDHSFAMRSDHSLWSWGSNNEGQLGNAAITAGQSLVPVQVTSLCNIRITGALDVPITADRRVCGPGTYTFSISVPGAVSYIWTLPAGWSGMSTSNSITVTIGEEAANVSEISVLANIPCGISSSQTLRVLFANCLETDIHVPWWQTSYILFGIILVFAVLLWWLRGFKGKKPKPPLPRPN